MLLKKHTLSRQAKRAFKLERNPFDELSVQSSEDIFTTPDIRYVREMMFQTATCGGLLAVWGESGSGKTLLRHDLTERLYREDRHTVIIEPCVLGMEDNDRTGTPLKATHIAEAILRTIAPGERPKQSSEARFAQVHQALKAGYDRSQCGHVLIIEEAHSLPLPTLRHLKRFSELKHGFKPLLSIILLGQSALRDKLSGRNLSVREVVQRCERIQLCPLDNDLADFLRFKFERAGKNVSEVIETSGIQMIREKMSVKTGRHPHTGREVYTSNLYPLAIGNLMIAAMNTAAEMGVPVINGDLIKHITSQTR